MHRQRRTLSPDDRRAVDVVLDHAGMSSVTKITTGVPPQRIAAVTRLLHLLSAMPEVEPPRDLVARTMERIDGDAARRAEHASSHPWLDPSTTRSTASLRIETSSSE